MVARRGDGDVAVRAAEDDDIDALVALENAAFSGDRLTRRSFRHAVRSPSILALVAVRADVLQGYVFVETRRNARLARLSSVAVSPGARGSGLGRILVEAAEAEALRRGCDRLRLEVRADNDHAIELYRTGGYRETGRVEDYYEDGTAALKLERTLA